jgi:AmmeMemoRadiSam system protein B
MDRIRKAYVAGKFYPSHAGEIKNLIDSIRERNIYKVPSELDFRNLIGAILPHAGHVFSAYQTLPVFEILKEVNADIDSFLILHPLHRGGEREFGSDAHTHWETPLGAMELDSEFLEEMEIYRSEQLLNQEHSAEVILPFLQYYGFGSKKIIPVGITNQTPENARLVSEMIRKASLKTNRKIFIIASSDFSHFLSAESGRKQDQKVIDAIFSKDIERIFHIIRSEGISVCGYGPIMTLMDYSMKTHPDYKSEILARGHSGQVHASSEVVDYISFLFYN